MLNVRLTTSDVADFLKDSFSYEAVEKLVDWLNEVEGEEKVYYLGDLRACFSEIAPEDYYPEDDEDNVIAELSNGNLLIVG